MLLCTEILLSQNKGNIRLELRSESHAKEATKRSVVTQFSGGVHALHLHSQWSTSFANRLTRRGQGQVLSCSYTSDFPGPAPHTWLASTPKRLWTLLVHWLRQINKSRMGLVDLIRASEKQVK